MNANPYDPNPYERRGERDRERKVFTVRTSGSVHLYGPELEILDTPEFQRLASIKQLGTSYFVFRGAVHTRFEHALGAVHIAQRIIDIVNRNPHAETRIDKRQIRLIRLLALLHDIPHVPFGHTLEDEFGLLERHDRNPARINRLLWQSRIGTIVEEALDEEELETLRRMVAAKTDDDFIALGTDAFCVDIVVNTVCADALDYVQRDMEACGMPVELGERFLEYFVITKPDVPVAVNRSRMALFLEKRGMPRPDVESEVVKLLSYRYELAERVYFHHAKNAASVMIGRAVQALGLDKRDQNFDHLSDELLLALLAEPELASILGVQTAPPSEDESHFARELGQMLRSRALYKIAYLGVADDFGVRREDVLAKWGSPDNRRKLEDLLAGLAGVEPGNVLVHLPPAKMAEKAADVLVETTDKAIVRLSEWDRSHSGRVAALNDAHRRLWRVAVYAHPDLDDGQRRLIRAAAERELGVPSRYVDEQPDRYLELVFDRMAVGSSWTAEDRAALAGKARAQEAEPTSLEEAEQLVRALVEASRAASDDRTHP
jgi:HD superfamily phosphohydrolase